MSTIRIEVTGIGGEFQHHYLSPKETKEIIKLGKKGNTEDVVDGFLNGGKLFEKSNYKGAYGCSIDATFTANGKKFKPGKLILEKKIDDKKPYTDGGNLYYISKGEITGSIEIDVKDKFDAKLLHIYYVEFDLLEGWKSGNIISQIFYDGEEIFADFTDNGQDYEHVGCIYTADKNGNYKDTDIFLMFDVDEGLWKFDASVF